MRYLAAWSVIASRAQPLTHVAMQYLVDPVNGSLHLKTNSNKQYEDQQVPLSMPPIGIDEDQKPPLSMLQLETWVEEHRLNSAIFSC